METSRRRAALSGPAISAQVAAAHTSHVWLLSLLAGWGHWWSWAMGNCVTSGETTVTAAGGGGGVDEDDKRQRRRWKASREDQLGMVPGRIFSNDGHSRTASVFTQQGRKGINQDAMLIWDGFGGDEDGVLSGFFDSHGSHGHLVVRRARDSLPLGLMSAARALSKNGLDMPSVAWRKVFVRAYKAMDKDLRSHPSLDSFCSGSTTVPVLKLVRAMGHDIPPL